MKRKVWLNFLLLCTSILCCSDMIEKGKESITKYTLKNVEIISHKNGDYDAGIFSVEGRACSNDNTEIIDDSCFAWYADDLLIGKGKEFTLKEELLPGEHEIKLIVTETSGAYGTRSIILNVGSVFEEDFTGTSYYDAGASNARWDLQRGEIRLRPYADYNIAGTCASCSGYYYSIVISGDYAFAAAYDNGIAVIDISDPENPVYIKNYTHTDFSFTGVTTAGTSVIELAVSGDKLFVSNGGDNDSGEPEYWMLNIPADPSAQDLTYQAHCDLPEGAIYTRSNGITVLDNYAYIGCVSDDANNKGIYKIDVTESGAITPPPPITLDYVQDVAKNMSVDEDYIYVADDSSGFFLLLIQLHPLLSVLLRLWAHAD